MLHYSLEEFFCPRLTLILRSDTPKAHTGYAPSSLVLLMALLPIALLLLFLTNVGSELRQMKQAFDSFATRRSFDWQQFPPPVTETMFVTTTVFTSSQSLNTSPTYSTCTPLVTQIHSTSELVPRLRPPEQTAPTKVAEPPRLTPESSFTYSEENSLLPISTFSFEWSFPSDLIPTAQRSWHKFVGGLGVVWQVFRKVYHYPLDPA